MKQGHSESRWVFRCLLNVTKESASQIVCGRAFQSLGAKVEKALKPNCFLVCFSASVDRIAMMSEGVAQEHIGK